MTLPRAFLSALLAGLLLMLTACGSIPGSSGVGVAPIDDGEGAPQVQINPGAPSPGQNPSEIVRGFLVAGAGVSNNYEVAREYLTGSAAQEWNPQAGVTVTPSGVEIADIPAEITSDQQNVAINIPVLGSLDGGGQFTLAPADAQASLEFKLRQENGEWRISEAPEGTVLSPSGFTSLFQAYPIYFYSADYAYLVPQHRWFLQRAAVATDVVRNLLVGPPEWLSGAVTSAIPEGTRLDSDAVTITDGIATVTFHEDINALPDDEQARLWAQVEASLMRISGVTSVEIMAGNERLSASAPGTASRVVPIDQRPVVLSGERLARLAGTTLEEVPGGPDLSDQEASHPAVSIDESSYVYLRGGEESLVRFDEDAREPREIISGDGLLAPTIDISNHVWTAERSKPEQIIVAGPSGATGALSAPFLKGREVHEIAVARDGSRLVVLSEDSAGVMRVELTGIRRDGSNAPIGLSTTAPLEIAQGVQSITDISWAGLGHLVMLAEIDGSTHVVRLPIGGLPEDLGVVSDAECITAGDDTTTVRVGTSDGTITSLVGGSWQRIVDVSARFPRYPG